MQRLLLVEDERDIRKIAEMSLVHVGRFDVLVASSGAEALEIAGRELPDAILLDVMMPGMDGPETLRRLRSEERTRHIPIVFLTACTQPDELERFVSLGARGVIAKPFDPMQLPAQLRALLRPAVLDERALAQLRALEDASGLPLLAEVLRIFLDELPARRAAVRAAAEAGDAHALERAAHALRGAAAAVGATGVQAACAAIEEGAEAKKLRESVLLVGKLETELELARAALAEMQGT